VLGRVAPLLAIAVALGAATPARALVWPDVDERIARDLSAPDAATRRLAARNLKSLSRGRGGPLAVAALEDPDDDVRLAAADAAIRLGAVEATEVVLPWLNGRDVRARRKACEVARAMPNPRAVTPLARSLGDPDSDVRAAAAEALGHQTSAEAVPPLLGRLDDPTPLVRVQIVDALARLADPRTLVPLVGKVQDSSPEVREAVARALGELGDRRASPALVLALRDQVGDVRREAIVAIGRMRASDAVDALAPFLGDRAASLRLAAFEALGKIGTPEALRVLVGAVAKGDDAAGTLDHTPVRDALVTSGAASVPALRDLLRSGAASSQEATTAAWVLGELHARDEAPGIVAAMRRGVLPAAAALHALGGAGSPATVPVILEFVADPSPAVRGEALRAALALLDPARPDGRAVEPLTAALRDSHLTAAERVLAVALLGRTGAARAAPFLVDLVRSRDASLRVAAIDALGALASGSPAPDQGVQRDADDVLLQALEAPDPRVRLHAAVALGDAGAERARDVLLSRLDGGDEVDRAAVLAALAGVVARYPTDAAIGRLRSALQLSAGAERDAIIQVLGMPKIASAVDALAAAASSPTPEDRRTAAALYAAHPDDPRSLGPARAMLADPDAATRAQAAWSLGSIGDGSDIGRLGALAHGDDADAAADATAAIGRILGRTRAAASGAAWLCPLVADRRPVVRANALAGLALAAVRCGDGAAERAALAGDPSDDVRASAALALAHAPSGDDRRALERCATSDPAGRVATRCRAQSAPVPARTRPTLVYVVPGGASGPRPGAPYALACADGMLRLGVSDRRGAVFDPAAPEGELRLSSAR
jgi:HEAT repeat protein